MICVQAFLSEANANWVAASYPAMILLLAYGTSRLAGQLPARLMLPAIAINLVLTAILGAVLAIGSFGPLTPNLIRFAACGAGRKWPKQQTGLPKRIMPQPLSPIAGQVRLSALAFNRKGLLYRLPLATKTGGKGNHYQRSYPLDDTIARPWLAIIEGDSRPP